MCSTVFAQFNRVVCIEFLCTSNYHISKTRNTLGKIVRLLRKCFNCARYFCTFHTLTPLPAYLLAALVQVDGPTVVLSFRVNGIVEYFASVFPVSVEDPSPI